MAGYARHIMAFVAVALLSVTGARLSAQEYPNPFSLYEQEGSRVSTEWGVGIGGVYTGFSRISTDAVALNSRPSIQGHIDMGVVIGRYFGVADERIGEAILSFTPDNNRSQAVKTERNQLVVDCYNANPSSMEVALDNIATMESEHKGLILLELGEWSAEAHTNILRKADAIAERIILVGKEFAGAYEASEGLQCKYALYPTTTEALSALEKEPISGALILLKGSRGIKLEQLVEVL